MKTQTAALLLAALLLSGCSPRIVQRSGDWSGAGPEVEMKDLSFKPLAGVKLTKSELSLESQTFEGFEVENAYRKRSTSNSEVDWTRATWVELSALSKEKHWKIWKDELENSWNKFFVKNPGYRGWKVISPPQLKVRAVRGFHPLFQVVLESLHGELWEVSMGLHGDIEKATATGSHFESRMRASFDTSAMVFPLGPKKSTIQRVLFNSLVSFSPVSNSHVSLDSQAPEKLQGPGPYQFALVDPRSDEVHAFYFINSFYSWLERTWKIAQPFHVNVVTHLGYPEKTNAAFYFQGLIRLGSGDDQTFSRLALDPTIVIHESSHAIIEAWAHLPYQGEGGSINEGFADTLTTLYLHSPYLGDSSYLKAPFRRAVDTPLAMNLKNGGLYHDSLIVSGYFWQLRGQVGEEKTWDLVLHTLSRLLPNSNFNDFSKQLHKSAVQSLTGPDLEKSLHLMEILKL